MQRNTAIYCVLDCGHLETNINVICAYRPSPYRAVSTLRLCYKKISQLMLCSEIITVWSEIHTKHVKTLCGQNVELLNVQGCEGVGGVAQLV